MKIGFTGTVRCRNVAHFGAGMLFALMLASCGGGGGSPGVTGNVSGGTGSSTSANKAAMTLDLIDVAGVTTTSVTAASPITARAKVLSATGQPVANTVVTFTVGPNLTSLTPSSGTALTNASGIATVTIAPKDLLTAQSQSGAADSITATATVGDQTLTAKSPYALGATSITLRLAAPSPSTINLNAYDTTPIKVDVLANGTLYTDQPVTVNFTSACAGSKATLPISATTVNGRAQVVYADKGCGATDVVTASVTGAQSVAANLVIAPPSAASIGFVSATPSDKAIVIKGAGGNGRTETAILTFQALDTFGQPLPNQLVNFTVNSTQTVTLQSTSATTDSSGKVVVAVNSGTAPTTFRVVATLASGGQSTISDTITVTTGQPVQTAFSLSAETFNIEGWSHDNEKTKINILMADQSGNPVADGTPVVFQTDSGAVGSASVGGCTTSNGGCSVDFRSQAPRFSPSTSSRRAGMATISVSSTSALYSLSGQIGVFLSGSSASYVRMLTSVTGITTGATTVLTLPYQLNTGDIVTFTGFTGADAGLLNNVTATVVSSTATTATFNINISGKTISTSSSGVSTAGAYIPLPISRTLTTTSCGNYTLVLELNDVNNNPLPLGTTVAVSNADKVSAGTITPATVPNIAPHDSSWNGSITPSTMAPLQGSIHYIPVKPDTTTCSAGGTTVSTGTFDVIVTTPLGTGVGYSFALRYPSP